MTEGDFYDAYNASFGLEDSPQRTALLEEAVRIADSLGNEEFGFDAREELVQSAVFSGAIEKAIVAYTWCLAQYDAQKPFAANSGWMLMWSYRWIVSSIASFPFMDRSEVHRMEDDIIRRFRDHGFGTRSLHVRSWSNAKFMGDMERAERARTEWLSVPFDGSIECLACDLQSEIDFSVFSGDIDRAKVLADALIKSRESCNRVPLHTFAALLEPLHDADRNEEATAYAEAGAPLIGGTSETIGDAGRFIDYYTRVGRIDDATRLFKSHIDGALRTSEEDLKLDFLLSVETLAQDDRRHLAAEKLKCDNDEAPVVLAKTIDDIAAAFDKRNGNVHVSETVRAFRSRS